MVDDTARYRNFAPQRSVFLSVNLKILVTSQSPFELKWFYFIFKTLIVASQFLPFCLFVIMKWSLGLQFILTSFYFEESSAFYFLICKFLVLPLRFERILVYYNIGHRLQATIHVTKWLGKVLLRQMSRIS